MASIAAIPPSGRAIPGHERVSAAEREAARLLARAIAVSLHDPAVADYVKIALASSAAKEQKLHLASFLAGRGGRLVAAMVRNGGMTAAQLGEAIGAVRDLEFYMPVQAHRDRWTGSEATLVAIALREEEGPEAYDSEGVHRFLSRAFPPVQPVLVLAPVETDLHAQIELNMRGQAERACSPLRRETLTEAAVRCLNASPRDRLRPLDSQVPAEVVGLYVTAIELASDQCGGECWAWGDPEYQIITFGRTPTSGSRMAIIQCSGNGATWQPLPQGYRWDMNGRTWAGRGLLLNRDQMNTVLQADTGWAHQFWEDDQEDCTLVPSVDPWPELVSVAHTLYNLYAWISLYDPMVIFAVRSLVDGIQNLVMGGDDYIGTIVHEDVSPYGDGQGSNHNTVIQRVKNGNNLFIGRATIKPYTSSGVYVGPVATVRISHPPSTMFPLGSGIQLTAYGLDSYGTHVPDRPVSWSSTNPAIASVDANGFVTGYQEGSVVITGLIDGFSASITVYPKAIGAPTSVRIDHESVTLPPGQWMYVYARLYDSNGFEVPTSGNYEWSSADPSSCQVGYGSVDSEAYLVGNGGIGALITVTTSEGLTDTVYCSVGGGDARIPTRKRRLEPATPTTPTSSKRASNN